MRMCNVSVLLVIIVDLGIRPNVFQSSLHVLLHHNRLMDTQGLLPKLVQHLSKDQKQTILGLTTFL